MNNNTQRNQRGQMICLPTSKIRYRTQQSAERMLAQLIVHGSQYQIPCRAYLCDRCGGYHLTSQPRREYS